MTLSEKAKKYKRHFNIINGDEIIWSESVFSGSYKKPKYDGERWIRGTVVAESYGSKKGQHSFSVKVSNCDGQQARAIVVGKTIRRMGRNLYKECYLVKRNEVNEERATKDKNERSAKAKEQKYWNWLLEGKLEKIPNEWLNKNMK